MLMNVYRASDDSWFLLVLESSRWPALAKGIGRPDLLAHDDRQAGRDVGRRGSAFERALDPVVVGDREMGHAASRGRADHGLWCSERIEARRGVAVEVNEGSAGGHDRGRPA